jgi:hypothetical protein
MRLQKDAECNDKKNRRNNIRFSGGSKIIALSVILMSVRLKIVIFDCRSARCYSDDC